MDLFDLTDLQGEDNTPGLRGYVYIAPEEDFASIKRAPKASATPGGTVVITESHTFKAGKGWTKIYMTLDSGDLKAEPTGERDGRGQKVTFEGFHPGNRAASLEMSRRLKNIGILMLVPDADGKYTQVGTEGLPCEMLGNYGTGKLSSGRKGTVFKGEAYTNSLYIYEGDITLKDGTVVGADPGN